MDHDAVVSMSWGTLTTDLSTLAADDAHLTNPNNLTARSLVLAEKLKISCFRSISVFLGRLPQHNRN